MLATRQSRLPAASARRIARPSTRRALAVVAAGGAAGPAAASAAALSVVAVANASAAAPTPLAQAAAQAAADASLFLAQERGQLRDLVEQAAAGVADGSAAEAVGAAFKAAAAPFAVFGGGAALLNALFCGATGLIAYALLFKAPKQ